MPGWSLCGFVISKHLPQPVEPDESLPPLLRGRTYADFRDENAYFVVAFDLMLTLYGLGFSLPGIVEWRQTLRGHRQS